MGVYACRNRLILHFTVSYCLLEQMCVMHQGSRAVAPVARHGNRDGHHVPYRPLPDHVPSSASRAVSPVAGHSVRDGRGVSPIAGSRVVSPVPDRVWYRPSLDHVSSCAVVSVAGSRAVEAPSPDHVSSYPGPCRRPRCPCRVHGRTRRTPVTCHAPAQQSPVADVANRCLRTSILLPCRGAS